MKVTECPICNAAIIECDNDVYLDYPAVAYDEYKSQWTLMKVGSMTLASVGNPGMGGTGHSLHEHQPEDSVMAQ